MRLAAVLGQAPAKRLLLRLLQRGRVPQSLLLEAQRGWGATTLAQALAQALLCARPQADGDACGNCDNCRLCEGGQHPDLLVCPPGMARMKAEVFRAEVVERAYDSPLQANRRVIILPGIEAATAAVGNALLKVLEEPPPRLHWVLTKLPGPMALTTIISRCQRLRLLPLAVGDLTTLLERRGLSPAEAGALALSGQGSHRELIGERAQVVPVDDLIALVVQPFDLGRITAVVQALPAGSPLEGVTDAAWQRDTLGRWLERLQTELRLRLQRPGAERALGALERVATARIDLRLNLSPRVVLERLALGA